MKNQSDVKKSLYQLLLYLIVGAGATIVEWLAFYIFNQRMLFNYFWATTIAFVFSTFANWLLGRMIMFKGTNNILAELIKVYATSIIGLLMNLFIMWIAVEHLFANEMLSKMAATGIVFVWNFLIRKLVIYRI